MAKRQIVPPLIGHIVKDFYIGGTHITICDDACKSKEEVPVILERIKQIAVNSWANDAMRETQAQKQQQQEDGNPS